MLDHTHAVQLKLSENLDSARDLKQQLFRTTACDDRDSCPHPHVKSRDHPLMDHELSKAELHALCKGIRARMVKTKAILMMQKDRMSLSPTVDSQLISKQSFSFRTLIEKYDSIFVCATT